MSYDRIYSDNHAHFGEAPDELLVNWAHLLDPSLPILDVGCGQGRNPLYLASLGISVDGVEPSGVAVKQLRTVAAAKGAEIRVHHAGFGDVDLPEGGHGLTELCRAGVLGRKESHAQDEHRQQKQYRLNWSQIEFPLNLYFDENNPKLKP